jgi:hypothetical protein
MLPSHGQVEDGGGGARRQLPWLVGALDSEEIGERILVSAF